MSQNEVNSLAIQTLREGKINNARSLLIARTESHQALSTGAIGAVKLAGIPVLKQWIAAEYPAKSGKPRLWHRDLDRQTNPDNKGVRIPVNQPFLVNTPDYGLIEMQYAHDAAAAEVYTNGTIEMHSKTFSDRYGRRDKAFASEITSHFSFQREAPC